MATGVVIRDGEKRRANSMLALVNRINEGNPNFRPYAVGDDAPAARVTASDVIKLGQREAGETPTGKWADRDGDSDGA